jgi:hypothetical protein
MKSILALVGVMLTAASATAQPPALASPAPIFHVVGKTIPEKGHVVFLSYKSVSEMVPVKELINVNGKQVEVTKFATRVTYVPVEATYDISNSRVITTDSKQLAIDEVWKRLKAGTVVAVSGDTQAPAAPFLRALNANTLVIIPGPPKKQP